MRSMTYLEIYRRIRGGRLTPAEVAEGSPPLNPNLVDLALEGLRAAKIIGVVSTPQGTRIELLPGAQDEAAAIALGRSEGLDMARSVLE